MHTRPGLILFALITAAFALSGCASRETTPTIADEMRGAAAEIQEEADHRAKLAADWERGQALISSGERKMERAKRRIRSAERDLERGQRELQEGESELSEGRRLVAESERQFENLRQHEMQQKPGNPEERARAR